MTEKVICEEERTGKSETGKEIKELLRGIEERAGTGAPQNVLEYESKWESAPTPEWDPTSRASEIKSRKAKDLRLFASASVVNIDVARVKPNRMQPRAYFESNAAIRLADSIRRYGILQPLTVRVLPEEDGEKGLAAFEIVAGERRFRAAKMLGMRSVPCIIVSADDKKSAELALIENMLREDLNIFEMARAIEKLTRTYSLTQEEVAKSLSMSQSAVANKLRLLRFSEEEQRLILENKLTERHARALLKLPEGEARLGALEGVIKARMNVSATEKYVDELIKALAEREEAPTEDEKLPAQCRKVPIIKDIRLFYNSLDRALCIVRSAGIEISSAKREDERGITIEINIPNPRRVG